MFRKTIMALAVWLASGLGLSAGAATLLDTSEMLAANPDAAAQLPPAQEFTLTTAGNYVVTLRDLGVVSSLRQPGDFPTLQSLRALVTRDLQVVAELEIEYPTNTPQLPKTQVFAGTPGSYRVHVLGAVASGEAGGFFDLDVTPSAGGTAILEVANRIETRSGPAPDQTVLQTTLAITESGTYRVRALDRSFPAALINRDVLVLQRSPQVRVALDHRGAFSTADVGTFTAQAGDSFDLIIIASSGADQAGLYGAMVQGGPSNSVIYRSENGVGRLPPARTLNIANAGTHTLTLADLAFPEALTSFSAAVIQNDAFVGSATGTTPSSLALSAGQAQLFVFTTTATTGAVSATLSDGAQTAYADVHMADASPDAATPAIYSFSPTDPIGAGNYTLTLDDLEFPSVLTSVQAAVVQGATLLHRLDAARSESITLPAGKLKVLVAASPPAMSGTLPGIGAFALSLQTQSSNALVFESTQGVGGLYTAVPINLPAAGRYDIALKDFEFPARLRVSWLAVTRGTSLVGQVIGSSSIQNLQLEAGQHVLNYLAQPAQNSNYGTFGLKVSDSAPVPVVTLTASPTSVSSGQDTTLTWSATNATACTASGGWTGTKAVTGTQQITGLTANATFEIECVGSGGRGNASVSVTINTAAPRRSGGGGHMDLAHLAGLMALLALARTRRRRRNEPECAAHAA